MLGRHPLAKETHHDMAIRNHFNDHEGYLNNETNPNLLSLQAFQSNDQQEDRVDDSRNSFHHGHLDESNEAKYRVFLESRGVEPNHYSQGGPESTAMYFSQNNYPETNLYRSFPFKYSPIATRREHLDHSRQDEVFYEDDNSAEDQEEDAWYNDISRTVRLAAKQREEMDNLNDL